MHQPDGFRARSPLLLIVFVCILPSSSSARAQTRPANAPASKFSLTIYSSADPATFDPQEVARNQNQYQGYQLPGYAVVREIRRIDVPVGDGAVKFTDVASGIDPTTVAFQSLTAPDTTSVLDQSYEYDLVNPDKLLEKYLGKPVIINRRQSSDAKANTVVETIEGTLLSYDPSNFVLQTNNLQLPIQILPRGPAISEIKLFDLDTGLITKPTLVWKLHAVQGGPHDAQVTYQTDNFTWRADYSVTLNKDDTAADVSAWVTIVNNSGAAYPDAKLKLVAGDVHRLNPPPARSGSTFGGQGGGGGEAKPQFAEKSFSEYHLYTLSRPTSIANSSTKQVGLFPTRVGVPVEKLYVYYGLAPECRTWTGNGNVGFDRELGTQSNKQVDAYVRLTNTEKAGMGVPLPAGRVRVYKKDDADDAIEFVGEDLIHHTPRDEPVLVRLGGTFDVVGDRKQTDFAVDHDGRVMTETIEISVRNHKDAPVKVLVKENLYRWSNWQITHASDKFEKQDARTIHFPVDVPANGEEKLTYTVKYTW